MAHNLSYDKFFNTPNVAETQKQPIQTSKDDSLTGFLKSANDTLGIINKTLGNLGIEPDFLKQKIKEKLGAGRQQPQQVQQQQPYREVFRTPQNKDVPKQEIKKNTEKMKLNIDKIINMIDLVLKFTKREDMTVVELKEFLNENKDLIEGLF